MREFDKRVVHLSGDDTNDLSNCMYILKTRGSAGGNKERRIKTK